MSDISDMITTISVRSPTIEDLNDIVRINRSSLPENYQVALFIDYIRSWKNYSCVGEVDGKVVGYIICRLENQRSFFSKNNMYNKAHIISVAVTEDVRRKGVASHMLVDVMEKVKQEEGIESIELEVRESNVGAIQLYLNYDFIKSKIDKSYYFDGENAVIMTYEFQR